MLVAVKKITDFTVLFKLAMTFLNYGNVELEPVFIAPFPSTFQLIWLQGCGISRNMKLSFSLYWRQGKNVGLSFKVNSDALILIYFRISGARSV